MKKTSILLIILISVLSSFSQLESSSKFIIHYQQGLNKYHSSEYPLAIEEWKKAVINTKSRYDKARCILNIGTCFKKMAQYDSAFFYYGKSQNILGTLDSLKLQGMIHNNLGTLCLETGAYKKAQEHLFKALEYKIQANDSSKIGATLLNIGEVQLRIGSLEIAENYYQQSLKIREAIKDTYGVLSCYINLGILEKKRGNFLRAHQYYDTVIAACDYEISNATDLRLISYENKASLFCLEGKPDSAFIYYKKALTISEKISSKADIAHNKNELAILDLNNGDFESALSNSLGAYNIARKANLFEVLPKFTKTISLAYEGTNNYKKAFSWLSKHILLKDSLVSIQKIREIKGMEYEYQTKKKESEIIQLSYENLQKEALLTQSRYITYGISISFILFISLGYLFWNKQKQKQKLALLESSLKASEEEKTRIGKNLHDGIAGSILKLAYETEKEQIKLSNKLLETYTHVRKLSHKLDGSIMHGDLFHERILDLIPETKEKETLHVTLIPHEMMLKEPFGTHFYRILQELITNNLKYSKASITKIEVSLQEQYLYLVYKDNGLGCEEFKHGNGFKHIYNRVELFDGEIRVQTAKNKGFKVNISIPYIS